MKRVKELRRKAASRVGAGKQVLSTSEARANFAEAIETAQVASAVIGFDRYGRTVAALVPVEAVYMLAGQGNAVAAAVRAAIKRQAQSFIVAVPSRVRSQSAGRKASPPRKKAAKRKTAKKKTVRRRTSTRA